MSTGLIEWEVGLGKFSSTFQLWSPINKSICLWGSRSIYCICFVLTINSCSALLQIFHSIFPTIWQIKIIIAIIIPILQMCKLKLKELDNLAQSYTAREWQNLDPHSGFPGFRLSTSAFQLQLLWSWVFVVQISAERLQEDAWLWISLSSNLDKFWLGYQ